MDTNEMRLSNLEHIEDIRQLRHEWIRHLDAALEGEMGEHFHDVIGLLSDLMTSEYTFTSNLHEEVSGIRGFAEFVGRASQFCSFSFHTLSNEDIEMAEEGRAVGSWYTLGLLTVKNNMLWAGSVSNEEYTNRHGKWQLAKLDMQYKFVSPYELGWSEKRFADPEICRLAL